MLLEALEREERADERRAAARKAEGWERAPAADTPGIISAFDDALGEWFGAKKARAPPRGGCAQSFRVQGRVCSSRPGGAG